MRRPSRTEATPNIADASHAEAQHDSETATTYVRSTNYCAQWFPPESR
jgi:hypothetical protein